MRTGSWLGFLLKAFLTLLGIVLLAVVLLWWISKPTQPDAFYTPAEALPPHAGTIVRVEPFTRMVPANAQAWRVLYTTTRFDGSIAPASAIILAPTKKSDTPADVIAWTHGTTGFAPACAPSVMEQPFANVPALAEAIDNGWIVVATDYIGLGTAGPHPYLIGEGQARSTLDAIRAARQMKEIRLSDKTVVWGHSQGGNAAMWTGVLAPSYTPELNINGVMAAAPATDLPGLVKAAEETPVGKILSAYIISAYSQTYPDVSFDDNVRPLARPIVRDMATRCLEGTKALFLVGESLIASSTIFSGDPTSGPLGNRLRENVPASEIGAPLMIAQGSSDELVLPALQDGFVRARCAAGQVIDYRVYYNEDHLSLVADDSPLKPELISWTKERFDGKPVAVQCTNTSR